MKLKPQKLEQANGVEQFSMVLGELWGETGFDDEATVERAAQWVEDHPEYRSEINQWWISLVLQTAIQNAPKKVWSRLVLNWARQSKEKDNQNH